MTDKEIIKALECCLSETTKVTCGDCPLHYRRSADCINYLTRNALNLINRLVKEMSENNV